MIAFFIFTFKGVLIKNKMPNITYGMLKALMEEYIQFLEDQSKNYTLTDEQLKLVLEIQKLTEEQLTKYTT